MSLNRKPIEIQILMDLLKPLTTRQSLLLTERNRDSHSWYWGQLVTETWWLWPAMSSLTPRPSPPPVSCGHFDQICTLVSLTDDPCIKQNVYPCLCESLCRLMPQFMQIKFLPLIFKALTYWLTSTLALTDYPITATHVLNSATDKTQQL